MVRRSEEREEGGFGTVFHVAVGPGDVSDRRERGEGAWSDS